MLVNSYPELTLNKETVIEEAKRAGFSLVDQYDFVKPDGMDYFLVFQTTN